MSSSKLEIAVAIGLLALMPAFSLRASYAADFKQDTRASVMQAQVVSVPAAVPSASALPKVPDGPDAASVGRLLESRPSDPDVPMPKPDLAAPTAAEHASPRTGIYGRREEGGGVLGLRFPFPAGPR